MIRPSVRSSFIPFTEMFEGHTAFIYLDVLGLATIGYGNLIDPPSMLAGLTFLRPDGTPATASEVSAAWLTVKNRQDLKLRGGGAFSTLTTIRATEESIQRLVQSKLDAFAAVLLDTFPTSASWPADAQLGLMSIGWAAGPHFAEHGRWPLFTTACNASDWDQAATHCHMDDTHNPGLRPRNAANVALFENAARAADPEILYWPRVLRAEKPEDDPIVSADNQPLFTSPEPPARDPIA